MSNKITATLAILGLVVALGVAIFKSSGTGIVDPNIAVLIQSISSLVEKLGPSDETFGAIGTRYPNGLAVGTNEVAKTGTFRISNTGTSFSRINTGFCDIYIASTSIAFGGFETRTVDCGARLGTLGTPGLGTLPGVTSGDVVFLQRSTSTTAAMNGFTISGVSASSTSGFITLKLTNSSTTPTSILAAATTSLNWFAASSTVSN